MLFPLFSMLRLERAFARPPTQFVLLHLKRAHLMEWARAVLATALGVGPAQALPPIMWQQEVDSVWKQIRESDGGARSVQGGRGWHPACPTGGEACLPDPWLPACLPRGCSGSPGGLQAHGVAAL